MANFTIRSKANFDQRQLVRIPKKNIIISTDYGVFVADVMISRLKKIIGFSEE